MNSLGERALGTYPLSIATSLAIEGAMGVHPDRPVNSSILRDYSELWINVRTLFRNYFNAVTKDFYYLFTQQQHLETFLQEIEFLKNVIRDVTSGSVKLVLYHSEYSNIERLFKKPLMRTDSTDNQIKYTKSLSEMIIGVVNDNQEIIRTKQLLERLDKKTLMITHFPIDLFVKTYSVLDLLESHTGVIKKKQSWHTKYVNGKHYPQIPFRMDFLSIFGDNDMFRPNLMVYRKAIIGLSEKYNWSHVTTRDKILYGIDSLTDKFLAANLREMIGNK